MTCMLLNACSLETKPGTGDAYVLDAGDFRHYVEYFNRMEDENITQAIPNEMAWDWMVENIPLFECPQDNFEEIYYFRWWTLRKHIKEIPRGHVMTEFLVERSYADRYNMISCALGHHIFESRWLHDPQYLDEYLHVWYRGNEGGPMEKLRKFSSWTAWALYNRYLVDGNKEFLVDMLPDLAWEYEAWESDHRLSNGLFWQYDVRDGMEEQISGGRHEQNERPTINSYMYGNAVALSRIAAMAGEKRLEELYAAMADTLRKLVLNHLWNPESAFFETRKEDGQFAGVREAIGYIPWYFSLPGPGYEKAWEQVTDPEGFLAPFGLTTAERRHPAFRTHGCCNCEWDGAIWPFATSQTLTAMANLLNGDQPAALNPDQPAALNPDQSVSLKDNQPAPLKDIQPASLDSDRSAPVDDSVFFRHMELYVESQYYRGRPYIGEYLDETTGYWLKGDQERSRYYNHSTFNDLVITGLVGLRPRADEIIEVNPLLPPGTWDWFCLDRVAYHGKILTILWDRTGTRYGKGKGLHVLVDGKEVASSENLEKLIIE